VSRENDGKSNCVFFFLIDFHSSISDSVVFAQDREFVEMDLPFNGMAGAAGALGAVGLGGPAAGRKGAISPVPHGSPGAMAENGVRQNRSVFSACGGISSCCGRRTSSTSAAGKANQENQLQERRRPENNEEPGFNDLQVRFSGDGGEQPPPPPSAASANPPPPSASAVAAIEAGQRDGDEAAGGESGPQVKISNL